MQQLKNSGGLRLIKTPNVSDSIIAYDSANRDVLGEQTNMYNANWMKLWDESKRIFDFYRIDSLTKTNTNENLITKNLSLLLTNDRQQLIEYYSNIKALRVNMVAFIDQLKSLKNRGAGLTKFLNVEYHFQ